MTSRDTEIERIAFSGVVTDWPDTGRSITVEVGPDCYEYPAIGEHITVLRSQPASERSADRTAAAPLLDVERLARAIQSTILTSPGEYTGPGMGAYRERWERLTDKAKRHVMGDAKALAAEYERLGASE
jgi:hypothetical protein